MFNWIWAFKELKEGRNVRWHDWPDSECLDMLKGNHIYYVTCREHTTCHWIPRAKYFEDNGWIPAVMPTRKI